MAAEVWVVVLGVILAGCCRHSLVCSGSTTAWLPVTRSRSTPQVSYTAGRKRSWIDKKSCIGDPWPSSIGRKNCSGGPSCSWSDSRNSEAQVDSPQDRSRVNRQNLRDPVMWLRSRTDPLKLIEVAQAVLILAFAFAIPILVVPTIAVLFIVLLERLGLTLLGKIVVLLAVAVIIWLSLVAVGYITIR